MRKDLYLPINKREIYRLLRGIGPILRGESPIDLERLQLNGMDRTAIEKFLGSYGISLADKAKIDAIKKEALEFIQTHLLNNGELEIPENIRSPKTDIYSLLQMATSSSQEKDDVLQQKWACALLRVMHTIYHLEDDIRFQYIHQIQEKIISKIKKYIHYDKSGQMYLGHEGNKVVPLVTFDVKRIKERESIIMKLLHKKENIVTEITDVVGIRLIAKSKLDALKIVNFLVQENILSYPNSIPGRTKNTLIPIEELEKVLKRGDKKQLGGYFRLLEEGVLVVDKSKNDNPHSVDYRAMNFTSREKIEIENREYQTQLNLLQELEGHYHELINKRTTRNPLYQTLVSHYEKIICSVKESLSRINSTISFYYPFEIQIMDTEAYEQYQKTYPKYKENQQKTARRRVLRSLLFESNTVKPKSRNFY
jgi:uncharacterized protein (TIGR04562 family)